MDEKEAQGDENAAPESDTPTEVSGDAHQSSDGPAEGEANPGDLPPAEDDQNDDAPDEPEPEVEVEQDPDSVTVTVTKADTTSGVQLHVNGTEFLLPIGKPVTVPSWVLPSLRRVAGVEFTTG